MAAFVWAAASAGNWSVGANWKVGGVAQAAPPTTADTVTFGAGTGFTQSNCTLDTTGNVSTIVFTGYTGTLTTTGQTLNISGGGVGTCTFVAGMTLTGNASSSIVLSGASPVLIGGTKSFPGTVSFTGSGTPVINSSNTFVNLTRTGTAVKTDALTLGAGQTVTGTLTIGGNSTQGVNRLLVQSGTIGTQRAITMTGAAVVISGDVDFMDVDFSGSPSWTNTGSKFIGDCGGNGTIITTNRTTPATQTATGTTSLTWSTHGWTSRVPLPQDNVVVSLAFIASQVVTLDMPRLGADINFTGTTGSPSWNATVSVSVFGSYTNVASIARTSSGSFTMTFAGRGNHTLTSAGINWPIDFFQGPGGTYALQDAYQTLGNTTTVNDGTFTTNDNSINCAVFTAQSGRATTLNLGASVLTVTSTAAGNPFQATATATTMNAPNATIILSTVSTAQRAIAFGTNAKIMGTVTYTVANSPGNIRIANVGATVGTLNVGPGRGVVFDSALTHTVTNWNVNGTVNGYVRMPGASATITAPKIAAYDITDNLDLRCDVALDAWVPAATNVLVARTVGVTGNPWAMYVLNTGALYFEFTTSDAVARSAQISSPGWTAGSRHYVRATYQSNVSSQYQVNFYEQVAGVWTLLGTVNGAVGIKTFATSTAILAVGASSAGGSVASGNFYHVEIHNNVLDDGTGIVFNADFTAKAFGANTFTESSSNAATVTLGSLAQVGDGRIAVTASTAASAATVSFATRASSDYITVQDNTASTTIPAYAGAHGVLVSNTTSWLATAAPSGTPNLMMMGIG